jgi:hypothetical protein
METINNDGEIINYWIKKRGTKNLYARLDENNNVLVRVPYLISKRTLEKFVIESYYKLIKKTKKKKKKVVENDNVKILGINYDISKIDNLDYLLMIKLKAYLKNNYLDICSKMNVVNPPRVVLKRVKGYLGQYNKKKHQITLNILIAHLDEDCVEYVIVHELTHIKFMNHQKEFWNEVEKYLPNYKILRSKSKKEFVYYENY